MCVGIYVRVKLCKGNKPSVAVDVDAPLPDCTSRNSYEIECSSKGGKKNTASGVFVAEHLRGFG